jgi:hypothetical protein
MDGRYAAIEEDRSHARHRAVPERVAGVDVDIAG